VSLAIPTRNYVRGWPESAQKIIAGAAICHHRALYIGVAANLFHANKSSASRLTKPTLADLWSRAWCLKQTYQTSKRFLRQGTFLYNQKNKLL
jgi:hypothetical protein